MLLKELLYNYYKYYIKEDKPVAIYLKPKRGSAINASSQNIGLKKGELFLEFPEGRIGREPGRIVIGDGATSYEHISYHSTSTNQFQPFITDPSIYIPRFEDTVPTPESSAIYDWNITNNAITEIGNGSTSGNVLPRVIGSIKKSLVLLFNDLANINIRLNNKYDKSEKISIDEDKIVVNSNGSTATIIDGTDIYRNDKAWPSPAPSGSLNDTLNTVDRMMNSAIMVKRLQASFDPFTGTTEIIIPAVNWVIDGYRCTGLLTYEIGGEADNNINIRSVRIDVRASGQDHCIIVQLNGQSSYQASCWFYFMYVVNYMVHDF